MTTCQRKFGFIREFTTRLSNKSEWDQDNILKLNRNAIKLCADGSKMNVQTEKRIYASRTKYCKNLISISSKC